MEREQKLAEKTRKEELKRQKEEERARKEAEEREKAKTKPQDMFRSETTKYSKFDDEVSLRLSLVFTDFLSRYFERASRHTMLLESRLVKGKLRN